MIIVPAIDLSGGKVVRLRQGKIEEKVIYSDNPLEFAEKWVKEGAKLLHIVDLDAALGLGDNSALIQSLTVNTGIDIQVGGGIRNRERVERLLNLGVKRVVLGTRAFKDKDFFVSLLKEFPGKVALGLDIKDNMVAVSGWKETISLDIPELIEGLEAEGLEWIVYTDVCRDGMLEGINFKGVKDFSVRVKSNLIISGGVSSARDLEELSKYRNIWGVIIGKALYDKRVELKRLIKEYQR
jgi:phosphoribosylformimino-5-aminoimidazole carboxamide ribotide isomerase